MVQATTNADTGTIYQPLKPEITVMLLQKYLCNICIGSTDCSPDTFCSAVFCKVILKEVLKNLELTIRKNYLNDRIKFLFSCHCSFPRPQTNLSDGQQWPRNKILPLILSKWRGSKPSSSRQQKSWCWQMKGNYFLSIMQVSGVLRTIHPEFMNPCCKIGVGFYFLGRGRQGFLVLTVCIMLPTVYSVPAQMVELFVEQLLWMIKK